MEYLIDLKKQDLSGKTALEGGISLGVDVNGDLKKIDETGTISSVGGSDIDESRLLPDSGPDDSWMHHSESMDLVTPADMTSMQSADWTLTAENAQENFSSKPWGLFDSGSYGFNIDGNGPAICTWTRRDGTPTMIDRLKIYTGSPGNNNGDSYEFYGSQDGNNWTLLGSWSAKWNSDSVKDTETNLNVLTLEVSNSTKYLYYKFSANSPTLDRLKGYGVTTKNEWKKFPVATASTAGLMAAADKTKLDGLDTIDVNESRLLPDPATVSANLAGHPVVFDVQEQGGAGDANTILLMHFDNDIVDYSPNAHIATKTGGVSFQTGKFGQGLKFASTTGGSYLQIPYSTSFNLATRSAWTFDVWVYATQTPSYTAIFTQRQASSPVSYQFCFYSSSRRPQLYTGSSYVATGEVPLNTWTHVAFTYMNGTLKIWIDGQLDSSFANVTLTDYGLPIEIGYHYSSTNEQFIGLLDELRLSSCDRTADQNDPMYSANGTSFTPPAKPYGVTSNRFKVSENGVVTAPADPADGDIPCFDATATTGGGNDSNTVALFHFDTEIKDEAAGNAAPISATKIGTATISTDDKKFGDSSLYFNSGRLLIPVDSSRMDTDPWVASVWFKMSSTSQTFLLNQDDDNVKSWGISTNSSSLHYFIRGGAEGSAHSFQTAEWNWLAVVKDTQKHLHIYLNGAKIDTYTGSYIKFDTANIGLGGMVQTSDSRNMTGYVDEFRLQFLSSDEVTQWTGTSIAVPDAPYSKPQTVGDWGGKLNKSKLPVLEAEPVDGNLLLYTARTFNVSDTMHLLHFDDPDQWFKDVTGNYTGDATRSYYAFSTDIKKFGNGCLQYQDPNGTSEHKSRELEIPAVTLKGPQDEVTMEFCFYVDQSCIFEIPSVMARKGNSANNWNFWLTSKVIYQGDVATHVKDVARLSYHDFDTVSNHVEVEVSWSRPAIAAGWHHFAFCRDSAYNHYVFLDGTMLIKVLGSQFGNSPYLCPIVPDATSSWLGVSLGFDTQVLGYCDELRYSSVCLYTKNFVPPSEPFTYDAGAANKDVKGWFPTPPGVIGLITGVNDWLPSADGHLNIPAATTSAAGLMAAADKAAIAGLTTCGIYPSAVAKSGAIDFNEVIDHGQYFIGGDTAHLNYPKTYSQNGGTLQVIRSGNYLTQSLVLFGQNKAFTRTCLNANDAASSRNFSNWRRLLMDADITESKARPGYFKLPGGIIVQWGVASNVTADGTTAVVFPLAFPGAMLTGYATAASGTASASGVVESVTGTSKTGMTLITKNHPGGDVDINVYWLAIGY